MKYKRKLLDIWKDIQAQRRMNKELWGTDIRQLPALYRRYRLLWALQQADAKRRHLKELISIIGPPVVLFVLNLIRVSFF